MCTNINNNNMPAAVCLQTPLEKEKIRDEFVDKALEPVLLRDIRKIVIECLSFANWSPILRLPMFIPYNPEISLKHKVCPLTKQSFADLAIPYLTANPIRKFAVVVIESGAQSAAICNPEAACKTLKEIYKDPVNNENVRRIRYYATNDGSPILTESASFTSKDNFFKSIDNYILAESFTTSKEIQKVRREFADDALSDSGLKSADNDFLISRESDFWHYITLMLHDEPEDKNAINLVMDFIDAGRTATLREVRAQIADVVGDKNALLQERLGKYFLYLEQYDQAIYHYEKAFSLNPIMKSSMDIKKIKDTSGFTHARFGQIRLKYGDLDEARIYLEAALKISKNKAHPQLSLEAASIAKIALKQLYSKQLEIMNEEEVQKENQSNTSAASLTASK